MHIDMKHLVCVSAAGVICLLLLPVDAAQHSMLQLQRQHLLLPTQPHHLRGKGVWVMHHAKENVTACQATQRVLAWQERGVVWQAGPQEMHGRDCWRLRT